MIGPFFVECSEHFPNLVFVKIDVDEADELAADCGVSAMPTFQVFDPAKGDELESCKVEELVGASKDKLKELCAKYN
uniref:Thioredoxin 1 n=1 Tax=Tetraselmis sp. GSL018 TaxID=582737 RepID=A0A061RGI8_9CHLO|eukprot:CAMPEP_0177587276 /NCGR_PEP_ID=MMETSP0419_2-20121207/5549_1 /TAXON_ID=582737 /ORGANISM="Tetraselmis sp., Strain GSL018" /LENGTH=76 /DNA_ID=CAMNT_0019077283 /DNA_START=647 /DNA_END=877 /DNA_ORIENTATION=+